MGEHTLNNIKIMCKVARTLSPRKSNWIFDQRRTGFYRMTASGVSSHTVMDVPKD